MFDIVTIDGVSTGIDEAFKRVTTLQELQAAVASVAKHTLASNFCLEPVTDGLFKALMAHEAISSEAAQAAVSCALMIGDATREIIGCRWASVQRILEAAMEPVEVVASETGELEDAYWMSVFANLAAVAAGEPSCKAWEPGFQYLIVEAMPAATVQAMADAMNRLGIKYDDGEICSKVMPALTAEEEAEFERLMDSTDEDEW